MKKTEILIRLIIVILFSINCTAKKEILKKTEETQLLGEAPLLKNKTMGLIKARAVFDQYEYAENAFVYLYKDITDHPDKPFLVSNPTDKDGYCQEEVEPGRYFIITIKRKTGLQNGPVENGDYFSYFGGNPIDVLKGKITNLNLILGRKIVPSNKIIEAEDKNKSGIKGKILFKNEPVSHAYAYVFKTTDHYFKSQPNYLSSQTDKDGNFTIELPEGIYYLFAKKKLFPQVKKGAPTRIHESAPAAETRENEEFAGPLEKGDYYCYYNENPIKVGKGYYNNVILNCIKKIGEKEYTVPATDTRVEGIIVDKKGNPVEGIYAYAYRGLKTNIESQPEFLSKKTRKDGKFVFNFPDGGLYYLGAKDVLGRLLKAGDLFGYYVSKDKDNAIFIKNGEVIKDIIIKVSPLE
ncbi:MAG: hypothetical protein AB1498_05240 [bacterium]